jgi:uncharacterized protein (TIGR02145 family)
MFEDSDGVLKARKSASWTEASDRSVIFDVNDFTSNNANYTFYAVANVSGNLTDNFVVGQTTIDNFTSTVATNTGTDPVSGSNMLMVGYTTIESLSPSTLPSQTIVLRHRVARFDINNLTSDGNPDNDNQESGSETFFEIKRIHVKNTLSEGYLTEEDSSNDGRAPLTEKVSLTGLNAIDVSGKTNINNGLAEGAFYLWPGVLAAGSGLDAPGSTVIEVEGVYIGDSEPNPVLFTVQLDSEQDILANKRYTLSVSRINQTTLAFTLTASKWGEGVDIPATPRAGAFEYAGFTLNSIPMEENAEGFDLSNNTADNILTFYTLSDVKITGALDATLTLDFGTPYKDSIKFEAVGAPIVTYSVGKIRQDYKIILKKTTYPVDGTLTIKEIDESGGTGNKKIFNIISLPGYDGTAHKPVLVRGKYSGQEEGVDEDRYWAPVNVGATSTTYSANLAGCGYVFQWGRNVPFVYGSSNDTYGGPVYPETPVEDYENKFITSASDWLIEPDDDLWSGANAQGPCPNGWRVPTAEELTVLADHAGISFSAGNLTIPHDGQSGANLNLPAGGARFGSSAVWSSRGAGGCYWSSTVSDASAMRLFFNSATPVVNASIRADGFSVRCIQK